MPDVNELAFFAHQYLLPSPSQTTMQGIWAATLSGTGTWMWHLPGHRCLNHHFAPAHLTPILPSLSANLHATSLALIMVPGLALHHSHSLLHHLPTDWHTKGLQAVVIHLLGHGFSAWFVLQQNPKCDDVRAIGCSVMYFD